MTSAATPAIAPATAPVRSTTSDARPANGDTSIPATTIQSRPLDAPRRAEVRRAGRGQAPLDDDGAGAARRQQHAQDVNSMTTPVRIAAIPAMRTGRGGTVST